MPSISEVQTPIKAGNEINEVDMIYCPILTLRKIASNEFQPTHIRVIYQKRYNVEIIVHRRDKMRPLSLLSNNTILTRLKDLFSVNPCFTIINIYSYIIMFTIMLFIGIFCC